MARIPSLIISGSNDNWGGYSVERYYERIGNLRYCHEDTQSFLTRLATQALPANFWSKDAAVQSWAFEEPGDNRDDTQGMDSVSVLYYSGHGIMDGNGVYKIPLGAIYNGKTSALSKDMAFGNEELRYVFWSTCNSVNITNGNNPLKTWWEPNKGGLRMLFGYHGLTWDWPSYGKYFWVNVDQGKSFARAFLDAGLVVDHKQVPVAVASASTQVEALNMLANERTFIKTPSVKGWYEWQYQGPPQGTVTPRIAMAKQPSELIHKTKFDKSRLNKLQKRVRDDFSKTQTLYHKDNKLNLFLGASNHENTVLIAPEKAKSIAKSAIDALELSMDIELADGETSQKFTCGGTLNGSGTLNEPTVIETIVHFRQAHEGVQSINAGHGIVLVHVDNDGKVCNIYDSTKPIIDALPGNNHDSRSPNGRIGYDFSGERSHLTEQIVTEIDYGKGFAKSRRARQKL